MQQYMTSPDIAGTFGYVGEIRQGPDGQLYQLSQTVDGLGNLGFSWLPIVGQALQQLSPLLSQGLGEEMFDQPQLGEVRIGADGQLYQYTQTVDGLGNIGFAWLPAIVKALPTVAQALPAVSSIVGSLFGGRAPAAAAPAAPAAPVAPAGGGVDLSQLIPQITQAVAGLLARSRRRRSALSGLGEEPDLYGFGEEPDLYGFGEEPDLYGLGQEPDDSLGLTEDELGLGDFYLGEDGGLYELQGLEEDLPEDLRGLELYPDESLGLTDDEPFSGMQGYLRETPGSQLQGYRTGHPSASPPFVPTANPSELWKPLW
jgi:hypothetical protein